MLLWKRANETKVTECQFADDAALLATTRDGANRSLQVYMQVAGDFGLTVSIPKTKVMVTGREVTEADRVPLYIDDTNMVESVCEFPYLGSVVDASGRMDTDIDRRVAQAPKHLVLCADLSFLTRTC